MKLFIAIVLQIFFSSTYAVFIKCNFIIVNWDLADEVGYFCDSVIVNNTNPEFIEEVSGDHLPGKTNNDVNGFASRGQKYKSVPRDINKFFPNVTLFNFYAAAFKAISASDLKPFPDLTVFSAVLGEITSIDSDLFVHNPKIHTIDFYENRLQHVGFNLLGDLKSLRRVDFMNNPCIDRIALSPEEISNLNLLLPIQCPPVT
jgi:hypothetical protein